MIDKNNPTPLYRQLGDAIIQKIDAGEFLPDTRLPTIRAIAAELGVNNTTVISAYKYLEQKHVVYSIRGSGTYVAKPKVPYHSASPPISENCINFADTSTDPAYFPTAAFRNAFDAVLARDGASAFSFDLDYLGYMPLREVICNLVAGQGINAMPENIQIVSDMRHGLEIAIDGLISAGDAVFVESLTAQGVAAAFTARGARVFEMPFMGNELSHDMEKIATLAKKHKPKVIFLMPTYQTPTGLCYNNQTKTKYLELANNLKAYIIEADIYGDFYYGEKPTPLKAMDEQDRVVYIKSFDRILTHGLAGFMVCPKSVASMTSVAKTLRNMGGGAGYIQRGLDFYLRNEDFAEHCAVMRSNYARRYKRAVAAAETFLTPYADVFFAEGGLSLWVRSKKIFSLQDFLKRQVLVSPARLYGSGAEYDFRISFAKADDLSKGIGIIASVLAELGGVDNGERR
ncbi:MAG: PLP-dependent aminotransferase family protein [Defluviitaleaceae bacterium]|nr:PLP-dependent aminotransferase family protein [Defluviitaleaceae bacterium]